MVDVSRVSLSPRLSCNHPLPPKHTPIQEHTVDALVGDLFKASIRDTFHRVRAGDPLWYENAGVLSDALLHEVEDTHLANVVRRNTAIANLGASFFNLRQLVEPAVGGVLEPLEGYLFSWELRPETILMTLSSRQVGCWVQKRGGGWGGVDGGIRCANLGIICPVFWPVDPCLMAW